MSEASALGGPQAAFVERSRVARLGTTMLDGTPHVVPVCPVLDLDRIVIASAFDRKVANIRDNPAVCIAFDEYSDDWDHGLFRSSCTGTPTWWRVVRSSIVTPRC